jgi:hypothetical protein
MEIEIWNKNIILMDERGNMRKPGKFPYSFRLHYTLIKAAVFLIRNLSRLSDGGYNISPFTILITGNF